MFRHTSCKLKCWLGYLSRRILTKHVNSGAIQNPCPTERQRNGCRCSRTIQSRSSFVHVLPKIIASSTADTVEVIAGEKLHQDAYAALRCFQPTISLCRHHNDKPDASAVSGYITSPFRGHQYLVIIDKNWEGTALSLFLESTRVQTPSRS